MMEEDTPQTIEAMVGDLAKSPMARAVMGAYQMAIREQNTPLAQAYQKLGGLMLQKQLFANYRENAKDIFAYLAERAVKSPLPEAEAFAQQLRDAQPQQPLRSYASDPITRLLAYMPLFVEGYPSASGRIMLPRMRNQLLAFLSNTEITDAPTRGPNRLATQFVDELAQSLAPGMARETICGQRR